MINNVSNKKTSGITLIALVITIIVLLIIAGITINAITSENAMQKGKEAKEKTEIGALRDEVNLLLINHKLSEKTLEEDLKEQFGENNVESIANINDAHYVTRNGHYFTIYDDGDVAEGKAIWDGGSEAPELKKENNVWNWYIYNAKQLKFLELFVNAGKTFTEAQKTELRALGYTPEEITIADDVTVYLMNNIDLGARNNNGTWTKPANWIPIGYTNDADHIFTATFEGQNHKIRGVYVDFNANFAGIFGNCHSINDLTVKNSYIKGTTCVGGIAGSTRGTESYIIKNCHNINTIVNATTGSSGILGQGGQGNNTKYTKVINCTNNGIITAGTGGRAGGIVAVLGNYAQISGCTNNGNVEGTGERVGGIVGATSNYSQISSCTNNGNVTGHNIHVGGIVGMTFDSSNVSECTNNGNVEGTGERVGGIVGGANQMTHISNSLNKGNVTGHDQMVGGIVGLLAQNNNNISNSTVEKCHNSGQVTGNKNNVGGIVGYIAGSTGKSTVKQCYNKGTVSGTTSVGKVIGGCQKTTILTEIGSTAGNVLKDLYWLDTINTNLPALGNISIQENNSYNIKPAPKDYTYEEFIALWE